MCHQVKVGTSAALYYWHRKAKSINAEIDYVISRGTAIIPIEVKANTRGSLKSLHQFIDEGHATCGIRLSHENFGKCDKIKIVPLHATELLPSPDFY